MTLLFLYPGQLSASHRIFTHQKKHYLVLSAEMYYDWATDEILMFSELFKRRVEMTNFLIGAGESTMSLEDEGMPKLKGEWVVLGQYHPTQPNITQGAVSVTVGDMRKKLAIFGYREWQRGLAMDKEVSTPESIKNPIPLTYANAFGGKDYTMNPIGKGYKMKELPAVEDPSQLILGDGDKPTPAAFSRIQSDWSPRVEVRGTMDQTWAQTVRPALPDDFSWEYYNTAPKDQRFKSGKYFLGNEKFEFVSMHPSKPLIQGKLPGFKTRMFYTKEGSNRLSELDTNLDTVLFCPEIDLAVMHWRAVIEVEDFRASNINNVVLAYEMLEGEKEREISYYQRDFDWRSRAWLEEDPLYRVMVTGPLIPDSHKSAQRITYEKALNDEGSKEIIKNVTDEIDSVKEKLKAPKQMVDALATLEKKTEAKAQDQATKTGKHEAMILSSMVKGKVEEMRIQMYDMTHSQDEKKALIESSDLSAEKKASLISRVEETGGGAFETPEIKELYDEIELIIPKYMRAPVSVNADDLVRPKLNKVASILEDFQKKKEIFAAEKSVSQLKSTIGSLKQQAESRKASNPNDEASELSILITTFEKMLQASQARLDNLLYGTPLPPDPLPRPNQTGDIDPDKVVSKEQFDESREGFVREMIKGAPPGSLDGIGDANKKAIELMQKNLEQSESFSEYIQNMRQSASEIGGTSGDSTQIMADAFLSGYRKMAHLHPDGTAPHDIPLDVVKKNLLEKYKLDKNLSGGDYACLDLRGVNLSGADLSHCYMEQVNLKGANLSGCNLKNSVIVRADLTDANLSGTELEGANIGASKMINTDFRGARWSKESVLELGEFSGANFESAVFKEMNLFNCMFERVNFRNLQMRSCFVLTSVFRDCDISNSFFELNSLMKSSLAGSVFDGAEIERCGLSEVSLDGASFNGAQITYLSMGQTDVSQGKEKGASFDRATISNASFVGASLHKSSFVGTNFRYSSLMYAALDNCNFSDSFLERVSFEDSSLKHSVFHGSNMMFCNMAGSNLKNADFSKAIMFGSDFVRSTMGGTDFAGANLKGTILENWRPGK